MIRAKDIKSIEERLIELLQHIPGTKEEKQIYFSSNGIKVPKTNFDTMWFSLVDRLGRSGATGAVFNLLNFKMHPRLRVILELMKRGDPIVLKSNEPAIVYDMFYGNGNIRKLGELFLEYTNEHDIPFSTIIKKDADDSRPLTQYDVALTFAGEDRPLVDAVARRLKNMGVTVFYDAFEEINMWGKDLTKHFEEVYKSQAKYCAMFISKHYINKAWPNFERQQALSRSIKENREYILPIKLDESEVPGLSSLIGYLNAKGLSADDLAKKICSKIKK